MKHFFILLTFLLVLSKLGYTQKNTIYDAEISNWIKTLDSLYLLDTKQEKFIRSIAEGPISLEITDSRKSDSTKKVLKGGWSKETIESIIGDTIYRVEYHDNLVGNVYLTFYYKNNNLIYSCLKYGLYKREEYYKDNQMVSRKEPNERIENNYVKENYKNLYEQGNKYLQEFMSKIIH